MVTKEQITETARKYLGIPYKNQGRSASGTDCGGLLLMVCRDLKVNDLEVLGYANSPDGESFEKHLSDNLKEIEKEDLQIGDIICCNYGKGIQHCGFLTQISPYLKICHAKRQKGVIEHRFMEGLEDYRAWTKTFRIREVEQD